MFEDTELAIRIFYFDLVISQLIHRIVVLLTTT